MTAWDCWPLLPPSGCSAAAGRRRLASEKFTLSIRPVRLIRGRRGPIRSGDDRSAAYDLPLSPPARLSLTARSPQRPDGEQRIG